MSQQPVASLSLDLDNKWSYLKTHGDDGWQEYPSYLDVVVPRFLEVLDSLDLKITVFVVGQDAQLERNHAALRMIAAAGHEIGNHSFKHEPWLHLYSPEELDQDFGLAEQTIEQVTGKRPVGFRGPGFSLSDEVLRALIRRGYEYDCSTFPTFLGPAARAYYFMKSSLSRQQLEERKELFGRFSDGFQSNAPYVWRDGASEILEIPVTTFPLFKTPIHLSYQLYLSGFSSWAARAYAWASLTACKWVGLGPSILLHPLDFLGADDEAELSFFPAMNLPSNRKVGLVTSVLKTMKSRFDVVTMREHARLIRTRQLRGRSIATATRGVTAEPA